MYMYDSGVMMEICFIHTSYLPITSIERIGLYSTEYILKLLASKRM